MRGEKSSILERAKRTLGAAFVSLFSLSRPSVFVRSKYGHAPTALRRNPTRWLTSLLEVPCHHTDIRARSFIAAYSATHSFQTETSHELLSNLYCAAAWEPRHASVRGTRSPAPAAPDATSTKCASAGPTITAEDAETVITTTRQKRRLPVISCSPRGLYRPGNPSRVGNIPQLGKRGKQIGRVGIPTSSTERQNQARIIKVHVASLRRSFIAAL